MLHRAALTPRRSCVRTPTSVTGNCPIQARLEAIDSAPACPRDREVLRLIEERPGLRAVDLADHLGRDSFPFKADVRRLKALGLTESLETGYRLSPRGKAVMTSLAADHRSTSHPPRLRTQDPHQPHQPLHQTNARTVGVLVDQRANEGGDQRQKRKMTGQGRPWCVPPVALRHSPALRRRNPLGRGDGRDLPYGRVSSRLRGSLRPTPNRRRGPNTTDDGTVVVVARRRRRWSAAP